MYTTETKIINVWRIDIKPDIQREVDPVKLCLNEGIIGIGWRVYGRPTSKEDYWEKAKAIYAKDADWVRAATPFLFQMKEGDLVWIRDLMGIYYLGRIEGDWEYRDEPVYMQADIVNVRKCKLFKVGANVPGGVSNSFRTRGTVQGINDQTVNLFSRFVYNKLAGQEIYDTKHEIYGKRDIFSFLTETDLEDIVALFLQHEGYLLIPSSLSSRNDIPFYELQLIHRSTGELAFVQVKSANIVLNPDYYARFPHKIFLFSPAGYSTPSNPYEHVITLKRDDIEKFIFNFKHIMPAHVRLWLEYIEEVK
ncbi:hypothetical protein [Thermosediminibacter oceani]|uniref:Uncharacterized protein n=1 Tax=Thermosediminibacter oceani (strain ATCC BAA-1034 / DSM 16646 / JW/IW-1228P) TaxID=555079 RepID=D9S1E8_THEOJ|nr:hypothetical protein [Thermosediminibacter oceani]ADL07225.1 conserved hypothetical protein [Thermosediminibacter oceani DSM 16646]